MILVMIEVLYTHTKIYHIGLDFRTVYFDSLHTA